MSRKQALAEQALKKIVDRVVQAAAPERIILFGSAARGAMGPNSDVDLLVIKKGNFRRLDVMGEIYANLSGVGHAVDVVVVTPEDVERFRDSQALVIKPALLEGRVVYDAAAV